MLLAFMLTLTSISSNALAKNVNISSEDLEKIEDELRQEGVKDEDIEKLINKLVNNEIWDSMNPLYEDLKPQIKSKNYSKTIYPDGSFKIVEIEEIPLEYAPRTKWNRKGYKVSKDWKLVKMAFKVDYERDDVENVGKITSQYGFEVFTFLGSYEEETKGYLDGWRNPTSAWFAIKYTATQDAGSQRYYIKIFVDGDGTWEEYTGD